METDVLIIGAGLAGLTVALETASKGLDVTIVDESFLLGGQLNQQTQVIRNLPSSYHPMRGFELAKKLTEEIKAFPIRYLLGHRVIGLYKDGSVGITDEKDVFPVKAKIIVIATGAAEGAVPFQKWTLPGVMTIGAAQTLVNKDFVLPGKEGLIVGSSDFAMDVTIQLLEVGVNIKGIVESNSELAARDQDKVERVKKMGVSIYLNSFIKEAKGVGQINKVDIQQPDQLITKEVDLVCVDGGRIPILDIFYQLGCSFGYQEEIGGWIPQYNNYFQTDREDVFLAGNAAGISTHGVLLLTAKIAGISICEVLNVVHKEQAEQIRASCWRELELLEVKHHPALWEGRRNHIENFTNPLIKDHFIS
ncbi:MAG TPA: FAD-dependent oxidoreductase [Bacillus sp. (in: firmicutes)]|nr:FAD-dependent oxidoreductase [Bacillus sp. (in: firmicutes)]